MHLKLYILYAYTHVCVEREGGFSLKKRKQKLNIKKQLPSKSSKVVRQINEHKKKKK